MVNDEDIPPDIDPKWQGDYDLARQFLLSYKGSLDTFNSYRREIERFFQWCLLRANKNFIDIGRQDFEIFLSFCQNPLKSWISLAVERRFIEKGGKKTPNNKWRPFVVKQSKVDTKLGKTLDKADYQLSEKAFKALFAVISSFYNYLIQDDHTQINPVLLIRQKSQYYKKTSNQYCTTIIRITMGLCD